MIENDQKRLWIERAHHMAGVRVKHLAQVFDENIDDVIEAVSGPPDPYRQR